MYRISLYILSLFLVHLSAQATYDFCTCDPRVLFHHEVCSHTESSGAREAIYLPTLPNNPYHFFHDYLWALSHYLITCTTPTKTRVTLFAERGDFDSSLCTAPTGNDTDVKGGLWTPCVLYILAHSVGIQDEDIHNYPTGQNWPYKGDTCFDTSVLFGVKPSQFGVAGFGAIQAFFRETSWYGREYFGDQSSDVSCATSKQTSGIIPLPDTMKAAALEHVRISVLQHLDLNTNESENNQKVNVLLYDRKDTAWRRWANAGVIHDILKKDSRLDVRYISVTPSSFVEQVQTYYWADIVLAPHGAAMASTIFMRPGADILEIYTACDANIAASRYIPKSWTGWHAYFLGLHLQYVQCHVADKPFKTTDELTNSSGALFNITGAPHIVRKEDVMPILEAAIERQVVRVQRNRALVDRPLYTVQTSWRNYGIASTRVLEWYHVQSTAVIVALCSVFFALLKCRARKKNNMEGV